MTDKKIDWADFASTCETNMAEASSLISVVRSALSVEADKHRNDCNAILGCIHILDAAIEKLETY